MNTKINKMQLEKKYKFNRNNIKNEITEVMFNNKNLNNKLKKGITNISHTQTRNYLKNKPEFDYKICNTNPNENNHIEFSKENKKQKASYDKKTPMNNFLLLNKLNGSHDESVEKNNPPQNSINHAITQPSENNNINNIKDNIKIINNSNNNNNNNTNVIQVSRKSYSKSPKKHNSVNNSNVNNIFVESQNIQLNKLKDFNNKESEINKKNSLFSFPEKKNKTPNAQIPIEYFNEFLDTYVREENNLEFKIIPNFMKEQTEINSKMRAIIVNWITEVHNRFKLLPDTLFLSIVIFDRYMSLIKNIEKQKLQLIGVTSLLIACKYEEIFSPEVRDFVCILDRTYDREDLMYQENEMMKYLKFEITFPTSLRYYEILRIEFGIEDKYYEYGIFLLEMSLLDCRFSKYQQNLIATTVCFIVKKLFNKDLKIEKFLENTKINLEELKNCLIDICFLLENIQASCYHAVTKKHNKILGDFQKIIF